MSFVDVQLKDIAALQYIEKTLGHSLQNLLVFPKFFLIETINWCNARCIMCGVDFSNKRKAVMSDDLFDKITSEIAKHSHHVEKVLLYLYGEPLLDKKLPLRIEKMKKAGVKKVNISTNASPLNQYNATQIINAGLDEIHIGFDSLKRDTFEAIRPQLKFEMVHENIVNFIHLRNQLNPNLDIRIQVTLQELNYQEADSLTRHWAPLLNRNDQVAVQKVHNWGATVEAMEFEDKDTANNIPCISLWGTLCIHVNGEVGLCCVDTNNDFPLGNVASQTFAQIWDDNPLKQMREKHIGGRRHEIPLCNGCTVWRESKSYSVTQGTN